VQIRAQERRPWELRGDAQSLNSFGEEIEAHLLQKKGATPEKAGEIARAIAKIFGKVAEPEQVKGDADKAKGGGPTARTAQLAFIGAEERIAAIALAERMLAGEEIDINADHSPRPLRKPVFAPYLGRKSCPLMLPMQPNQAWLRKGADEK
jgi:hypothetical protein